VFREGGSIGWARNRARSNLLMRGSLCWGHAVVCCLRVPCVCSMACSVRRSSAHAAAGVSCAAAGHQAVLHAAVSNLHQLAAAGGPAQEIGGCHRYTAGKRDVHMYTVLQPDTVALWRLPARL
jgi:hypothetical protein